MARRITTRSRRIPSGGTTIHIPTQRGRRGRRGTPQVLLVMPERHAWLTERAAAAAFHKLWMSRRALLPLWIAIATFLATGVLHVLTPWLWIPLAAITAGGPCGAAWLHYRRPADQRTSRWRLAAAIAAFITGLWLTAAVASGPLAPGLPAFWLLLTAAGQTVWHWLRRSTPDAPTADVLDGDVPAADVPAADEGVSK